MKGAYDDEIATALELIAEAGQVCAWHKEGELTLTDPNRPWLGGTPSEVIHNPSIVFVPATDGGSSFGLTKFKEGVPNFTTFGLMGAVGFEPKPGERVMRGTMPLVIVDVDALQPAEDVVLYVLSIE